MRNNPFLISLLIGLIVVLIVGGISLLVEMNTLRTNYKKEQAEKMSLEKDLDLLKKEKSALEVTIDKSNKQIEELRLENQKLEKLKDKLEESLKEELMKNKVGEE